MKVVELNQERLIVDHAKEMRSMHTKLLVIRASLYSISNPILLDRISFLSLVRFLFMQLSLISLYFIC